MHGIGRDLRYAVRSLLRAPAFTLLAALTLALGIGAATTIFSVIQNVLLDPYPYARRRPQRHAPDRDASRSRARAAARSSGSASSSSTRSRCAVRGRDRRRLRGRALLHERGHGAAQRRPDVGRTTSRSSASPPRSAVRSLPRTACPGAPPVFVMSHKAWADRFGADPGIVGQELRAERRAHDARRRDAAALLQAGGRRLQARAARPCRSRAADALLPAAGEPAARRDARAGGGRGAGGRPSASRSSIRRSTRSSSGPR